MKRDFSDSAKQELFSLIQQVREEEWSGITDSLGDWKYDVEAWVGNLNLLDYLDNMGKYHKKVLDKNDTTINDITVVFANVNSVSEQYRTRLAALLANLHGFEDTLKVIADVLLRTHGSLSEGLFVPNLRFVINQYLNISGYLNEITDDGISQEELLEMAKNEDELHGLMDLFVPAVLYKAPNIGVGEEFAIPVGPGVEVYYRVSGELHGNSSDEINVVLSQQKSELLELNIKTDFGQGLGVIMSSEYNAGISIEDLGADFRVTSEGCFYSYEYSEGVNTYGYAYGMLFSGRLSNEKFITTHLECGDITSTVGIRYSDEYDWTELPLLVAVKVPYTSQIPSFDEAWDMVGIPVTLFLGKKVLGILFAGATGGTSLVLTIA